MALGGAVAAQYRTQQSQCMFGHTKHAYLAMVAVPAASFSVTCIMPWLSHACAGHSHVRQPGTAARALARPVRPGGTDRLACAFILLSSNAFKRLLPCSHLG